MEAEWFRQEMDHKIMFDIPILLIAMPDVPRRKWLIQTNTADRVLSQFDDIRVSVLNGT